MNIASGQIGDREEVQLDVDGTSGSVEARALHKRVGDLSLDSRS